MFEVCAELCGCHDCDLEKWTTRVSSESEAGFWFRVLMSWSCSNSYWGGSSLSRKPGVGTSDWVLREFDIRRLRKLCNDDLKPKISHFCARENTQLHYLGNDSRRYAKEPCKWLVLRSLSKEGRSSSARLRFYKNWLRRLRSTIKM